MGDADAVKRRIPRPLSLPARFVVGHWRGLHALLPALGWLTALPWLLGLVLLDGLLLWADVRGQALRGVALAWLFGWALFLAWQLWASVGTWRSARRHRVMFGIPAPIAVPSGPARPVATPAPPPRPPELWTPARTAAAAQAALLLMALGTVVAVVVTVRPRALDMAELAAGGEPLGHAQMSVAEGGERLRLHGPLGAGDAERVRRFAERAPTVRLLELQGPGGRLHEAERLAEVATQRGWTVRATGRCANACVRALRGGRTQQVLPAAQLMLQRQAVKSVVPGTEALALWWQRRSWARAGLATMAVAKLLATPPSMVWVVAPDELVAGGFITLHERPLDVDLPERSDAPLESHAEALLANPVWQALAPRFPGLVEEAALRLQAARLQGLDAPLVQAAAQQLVDAAMPKLLAHTSAERQQEYLVLMDEQLAAATTLDGGACRAARNGDVMMRRQLPAALAQREGAWLVRTAQEAATPPRALSPLEREVLRRVLGWRGPAAMAALWRPGADTSLDCARARAWIATVLALPPGERRLALRAIFRV